MKVNYRGCFDGLWMQSCGVNRALAVLPQLHFLVAMDPAKMTDTRKNAYDAVCSN